MLEGGCSCGTVRYRLTSEPSSSHSCHCLNCQRQTGSAFVISLLIETDRVELLAGTSRARWTCLGTTAVRSRSFAVHRARCRSTATTRTRACCSSAAGHSTIRRESRPSHLHEIEAPLGHTARLGAGVRRLLRPTGALARFEPRAPRGDHGAGRRRLLAARTARMRVAAPLPRDPTSARASGSPCPSSAGSRRIAGLRRRDVPPEQQHRVHARERRRPQPRARTRAGDRQGHGPRRAGARAHRPRGSPRSWPPIYAVGDPRGRRRVSARRSSPHSSGSATSTATRRTDDAVGKELFVSVPSGQGRSRLMEALTKKRLPAVVTVRNWRTVAALAELTA